MHSVSKSFGDQRVLQDINLSVGAGEFVSIIGRSGCGKSTLLRLIAGLETLTAGTLLLDGGELSGKQFSGKRHRGKQHAAAGSEMRIMFQDARLLPWSTVLDNVKIGAAGYARRDADELARSVLDAVGLLERADDWPSVLSGGQRQRVALARALVGNPRLLLFDEPLGALDALTRIEMQSLIEKLWVQRGFTAVLVTHDVGEAVALSDRVVLIRDGQIACDTRISLARPREKDSGFSHYEKLLLDRVLEPDSRRQHGGRTGDYDI